MRYGRGYQRYRAFNINPVWAIILVNLAVLALSTVLRSVSIGTYRDFLSFFGLVPGLILEQPWTIVTNIFIHADFWHFLGNMITLYFFGLFLTRLVGNNKFLLVYFIGGLVGSLFFLLWGLWQSPLSIAIGASGAVYAIAGVLVVLMPNLRVFLYFIVPMPLWVVVLVFFVIWSFIPGVAWQAHLGGLIVGLIAGYFFKKRGRYYYYA